MTSAAPKPDEALAAALRAGDQSTFTALAERHRRELHVHCYRMLGSITDAEDLVQETFLRAWRGRAGFEGRSSIRAWLFRIATNACLDALEKRPRRLVPSDVEAPASPSAPALPPVELPWLEPYPDLLLDAVEEQPGERLVARETIELAFLAAIQHLPPRQRAALVLRDALGWSARETADLLEASVASANSLLQRARETLARRLPARPSDWNPTDEPDAAERSLQQRYADAWERADVAALVELLREDATMSMPPVPSWYQGRAAIGAFFERFVFGDEGPGHHRLVPIRANRQPAFAIYNRAPDEAVYSAFALLLLRVERDAIAELNGFVLPQLFPQFGLPPILEP